MPDHGKVGRDIMRSQTPDLAEILPAIMTNRYHGQMRGYADGMTAIASSFIIGPRNEPKGTVVRIDL